MSGPKSSLPLVSMYCAKYAGPDYAPDRMIDEALSFVRDNRDRPFFLYFATPIPHVAHGCRNAWSFFWPDTVGPILH